MGFTPLEGLMMAARPGDLDPGLLLHLEQAHQLPPAELGEILNTRSGLTGVAGTGDLRQLVGSAEPAARLAVDMYGYRARKYLGAYLAALGGAEAVLFGGGVGENQPEIRRRVVADMQWCGLELDADANARALGVAARISSASSRIEIWVLPVDEESLMAEEAMALLAPAKRGPA